MAKKNKYKGYRYINGYDTTRAEERAIEQAIAQSTKWFEHKYAAKPHYSTDELKRRRYQACRALWQMMPIEEVRATYSIDIPIDIAVKVVDMDSEPTWDDIADLFRG